MRDTTTARCGLLLLGGALMFPLTLAGQQQTPPAPPQGQQPTALVFEREVFEYPRVPRRNPFRPLVAGEQGPRFEQLRLMGILHADDPTLSVAVLGTSAVTVAPDGSSVSVGQGESWPLRVGQSTGNVRVIEIRTDQVVVEVVEYGITEQKIMQLETRRLGGTP